jgi:hypothetical protein
MRERTVIYKDDSYDVEIVVRQATLRQSFVRTKMYSREKAQMKARDAEVQSDPLMMWTAFRALPDCLGATVEIRNLDKEKQQLSTELSFDEFLELPDALIIMWQEAAYECNPHWVGKTEKEDESGEAEGPSDNSASTESSSPGSKPESQKTSQNGT